MINSENSCVSLLPRGSSTFSPRSLNVTIRKPHDFLLPLQLFRLMTGYPAAHYFLSGVGLKAGVMRQTGTFICFWCQLVLGLLCASAVLMPQPTETFFFTC